MSASTRSTTSIVFCFKSVQHKAYSFCCVLRGSVRAGVASNIVWSVCAGVASNIVWILLASGSTETVIPELKIPPGTRKRI